MTPQIVKILLAGSTVQTTQRLTELLASIHRKKHELTWHENPDEAYQAISTSAFDLVIVNEKLADCDWLRFINQLEENGCDVACIVISDTWQDELEDAVIQAGAADYLAVDLLRPRSFYHAINYAILRKRSREMLRHEQHLLQTLMDNIPDTIYFKDVESRFTRINQAQAKILGLTNPEEALGKTDFDFFEHASEAYADEQHIMETGEPLINKEEKIKRADGEYRYVSATKVPIINKIGQVLGTVGITRDITDRVVAEQELKVVKEQLERALNSINEELDVARQIQKSLLPRDLPQFKGIQAATAYIPSSAIGGDLYEVIKLDENRIGLLVFDVVGHGVPAALIGAMCKMIFSKSIARGFSPGQLFRQVNNELWSHFKGERHVAAFYGILDRQAMTFTFAKGGLPPALRLRADQTVVDHLVAAGIFIGLFPDEPFEEQVIPLQSHDKLVIHTDGMIETFNENREMFGLKRMEKILIDAQGEPVDRIVGRLLQAHRDYSAKTQFDDDVTVLVIEVE